MKKETRLIEAEIYTAEDGKEFTSEEECRRHEEYLEAEREYNMAKKHVESLEVEYDKDHEADFPIPLKVFLANEGNKTRYRTELGRGSGGSKYYKYYRLNNKDDREALALVMSHDDLGRSTPEEIIRNSGRMKFPCIVLVSNQYHWGRAMCTFEKEFEKIKKYCSIQGHALKDKENG